MHCCNNSPPARSKIMERVGQFEQIFTNKIREVVLDVLKDVRTSEPDLITIEATCKFCKVGDTVINGLIHDAATNGFPVVHLGKRTILVDRTRLIPWLNAGGLAVKQTDEPAADVRYLYGHGTTEPAPTKLRKVS